MPRSTLIAALQHCASTYVGANLDFIEHLGRRDRDADAEVILVHVAFAYIGPDRG